MRKVIPSHRMMIEKKRFVYDERGFSILAFVGLMTVLGIFGLAITSLVTTSYSLRIDHIDQDRANFVNQAGIEYAMKKIYEGRSPVTGSVRFGPGAFQVAQSGRSLRVSASVGEALVQHVVDLPRQAGCLDIDTSQSHTHYSGRELARIWLVKKCGQEVVLDKMKLSWSPDQGENFTKVRLSSVSQSRLYDAPPNVRSDTKIDLINATMIRNQQYKLKDIWFGVDMRNNRSFRLTLYFGDGSEKEVNFTLSRCPHSSC
ncbi:MAG: hypothetical protein HYT77_07085 [Deltaproteobacteria bacterium]|nr:hypothetical protein [Deltaproteobacteria bacterium]